MALNFHLGLPFNCVLKFYFRKFSTVTTIINHITMKIIENSNDLFDDMILIELLVKSE